MRAPEEAIREAGDGQSHLLAAPPPPEVKGQRVLAHHRMHMGELRVRPPSLGKRFLTCGRLTKPKLCGREQWLVRRRDAVTVSCTVQRPKSTEGTLNSRSPVVT